MAGNAAASAWGSITRSTRVAHSQPKLSATVDEVLHFTETLVAQPALAFMQVQMSAKAVEAHAEGSALQLPGLKVFAVAS
jgi:hypothetical protein